MKLLFAILVCCFATYSDAEASAAKLESIQFFNRMDNLERRLPTADQFGAYVKAITADIDSFLTANGTKDRVAATVTIAISPGGSTRAWLLNFDRTLPPKERSELINKLERRESLVVKGGPVAFCLSLSLWDAPPPSGNPAPVLFIPQEWKDALANIKGGAILPDGLPASIWNAHNHSQEPTPGAVH